MDIDRSTFETIGDGHSANSLTDEEVKRLDELQEEFAERTRNVESDNERREVQKDIQERLMQEGNQWADVWAHAIAHGHTRHDAKYRVMLDWSNRWVKTAKEGKSFGQFSDLQPLGSGQFGVVFRGYDNKRKGLVAIKLPHVPPNKMPSDWDTVLASAQQNASFFEEAKKHANITVPGCVAIYDSGMPDEFDIDQILAHLRTNPIWFSMQFIDGNSLDDLLHNTPGGYKRGETMLDAQVVELMITIAERLQNLHSTQSPNGKGGIIHKDLKPANILLDKQNNSWLTDFGLASTRFDQRVVGNRFSGTRAYAAPEQFAGIEVNEQTDIWAWGVIFYELLTGQLPFDGQNRICDQQSPVPKLRAARPDLPKYLESVIEKCLQRNRESRFGSFAAVREELQSSTGSAARRVHSEADRLDLLVNVGPNATNITNNLTERFESVIGENTRAFVGRQADIANIRTWVESNQCGFRLICGGPGVGKSALVSALSRIGSDSLEATFADSSVVQLLRGETWPSWPDVTVVPYFIMRGEHTTKPTEFLCSLLGQLSQKYNLPHYSRGTPEELDVALQQQLQIISRRLTHSGGKLLLLLIDGLDESLSAEGDASQGDTLLQHIPRNVPPGVFIVMCGRPRKEVVGLRGVLHREKLSFVELQGLSESNVQSMLHNVACIDRLDPAYVAQVTKRSQGNPLYVKLLVQELIQGRKHVNDVRTLPENLNGIYREIVARLIDRAAEPTLRILMTFALARELLTSDQVAGIVSQPREQVCRIIADCQEVLVERRSINGPPIYRMFHDSLSDFLRLYSDYAGMVSEVSRQFLMFCARNNSHHPAEPEISQIIDKLIERVTLQSGDAAALSLLIERASSMLTGYQLVLQNLRHSKEWIPAIMEMAHCVGPATARMTIHFLIATSEQEPSEVGRVIVELLRRQPRSKNNSDIVNSSSQMARIALEVAVAMIRNDSIASDCRKVLLDACASRDSNVRSLAIVAVFRVVRIDSKYDVGLEILTELANRSVWFGMIQPKPLEVFIGCVLGLFFERPRDRRMGNDLRRLVSGVIDRIIGLKFGLWLGPRVVVLLWGTLPDESNPLNLAELTEYKKYARAHPHIVADVNRMIDFIDPAHGDNEEFLRLIERLEKAWAVPESNLAFCATSQAWVSRTLAYDDSVMEQVYKMRERLPYDHFLHQDFLFWIRVVQIDRIGRGQMAPEPHWRPRVEELIRNYFVQQKGVIRGVREDFRLAGVTFGFMYLIEEQGSGQLTLLKELIDWAADGEDGMLHWGNMHRRHQPDALLARIIEFAGVEFGFGNPSARETAYFGIRCFLDHSVSFDLFLWDRLATVLVRMNLFHTDEVSRFMAELPGEFREAVMVRMNQILPKESVGSVLANFERVWPLFISGAGQTENTLRTRLQEFHRIFLGPQSVSTTLRFGVTQLMRLVQEVEPCQTQS